MKESDKNLLIKDLCSRIPYDTVVYVNGNGDVYLDSVNWYEEVAVRDYRTATYPIDDVKPYLRPMSSMTEEERRKFSIFIGKTEVYVQQVCLDADSMANPIIGGGKCVYWGLFDKCIDWLNEHHFDYRGLIEKGLALEAPEGMYN